MTGATRERRRDETPEARARRRARERRGFGAHLSALAIRAAFSSFRFLPMPVAFFLGRRIADLLWLLLPGRRRIAHENLRVAFGDRLCDRDRARLARRSLRSFSETLVEGVLLPGWIRSGHLARIVEDGPGVAAAHVSHRAGRPIIFFTGHFGAWEVGVRALVRNGWRIGVPYRSTKNEVLQDWIVRNRAIEGPEQFHRQGALRPLFRLLREGAAVTMFVDQNERSGIFVDFFGRPAATVPTVGMLAERCGAEVYFQVCDRIVAGRRYRLRTEGPITIPEGGTEEERVHAWTAAATRWIEARIRETPAEWLWIHRRWRTRPPEESASAE